MSKITTYFQNIKQNFINGVSFKSTIEKLLSYEDPFSVQFSSKSIFHNVLISKNVRLSRELSDILILDNGDFDKKILETCISFLENNLFSLDKHCEYENLYRQHILFILKKLLKDKNFFNQLKKFFCPTQSNLQKLILRSLLLPENTPISVAHVKKAVLSSLFTYLRQDIGSCFATAPAILIQQQYPEKMLKDLDDLLSKGCLSRSLKNTVLTVPINLLHSLGPLHKPVEVQSLGTRPIRTLSQDSGFILTFLNINLIDDENPYEECFRLLNNEFIQDLCKNSKNYISAHEILSLTLLKYYNISSKEHAEAKNRHTKNFSDYLLEFEKAKQTFIDISRNALLTSWELTLASLAEQEANSTKKHLIVALGIHNADDKLGIANILNQSIEEETGLLNEDIQGTESKYNHLRAQVDYINTRLLHSTKTQDTENLLAEFRLRKQELNRVLCEWDAAYEKKKQLHLLPGHILNYISEKILEYFQGIYDPEITKIDNNFYEDKTAGFRIFYTHGRKNVGTWTSLYSIKEFMVALSSFFSAIEMDLKDQFFSKNLSQEIERCLSQIISGIHRYDFLLEVLTRISVFYKEPLPKDPLDNLELLNYKPWVYLSGGSPQAFLKAYFELDETPSTMLKQAESPHELLAFFADATKDMPTGIKNNYLNQEKSCFLIASPTHLFLAKPADKMFRKCWDNTWYSYSWIRDVWQAQQKNFLSDTLLKKGAIFRLIEEIQKTVIGHFSFQSSFNNFFQDLTLTIPEFYEKILRFFSENKISYPHLNDDISSLLFNLTPLTEEQMLKENINNISEQLSYSSKISYEKFQDSIEKIVPKFGFLTAEELLILYKTLALKAFKTLYFNEDFHYRIIHAMRSLSLIFPAPLILGDSNWEKFYPGFTVNPGTQEIDFWIFSPEGSSGKPMTSWKKFFDKQFRWTLFYKPENYGFAEDLEEKLKLNLI